MNFADQLRNAKADEAQRQEEYLAKMWKNMLDEVFEKIKSKCLTSAKCGGKSTNINLSSIYGDLTGSRGFSDEKEAESNSDWVEKLFPRYCCYTKYGMQAPKYCFNLEDRDFIITEITSRCQREGLTVSSTFKDVDIFSLGTKKVRPGSLWERLNLPQKATGPDENGYYTVPAKVKAGTRYVISLDISW